ncbi:hypothetical protein ACEQ8H_001610 [Pleosporales sp. CAS-2024a]
MIVQSCLSLASLVLGAVTARSLDLTECSDDHDAPACAQPMTDVVAVTPGSFYTAKIRCYNCPYSEGAGTGGNRKEKLSFGDNDLLFNVQLSSDNHTVLINQQPFFPTLRTIPTPPELSVPQVRPNFSNRNLSVALECPEAICDLGRMKTDACRTWCRDLQLDRIPIDYLYLTKSTAYHGTDAVAEAEYWEFNIDAIGGFSQSIKQSEWGFSHRDQKMLNVVVEGIAVEIDENTRKGQDTLFSPLADDETVYNYRIVGVKLVDREYTFPAPKALSLTQRISRFFGNDIWEDKGRLVYIRDEWDVYGKAGTLRNLFGTVVHWELWEMLAIIAASLMGGLLALCGIYRLFLWIQRQRELMKWDGMDDVWDKLRREREEEEDAFLTGYRDEPDEGSSSRPPQYTDDLDIMKPLPTKPLPEKPLPSVPLIDA